MRKEYVLQGLECANCAAKIERGVKGLKGVEAASCSAINSSLIIEIESTYDKNPITDSITNEIKKIVKRYEPDVVVLPKDKENSLKVSSQAEESGGKERIIQLFFGCVVFIAAFIVNIETIKPYIFLISYVILGWGVVEKALKNILKGQIFDENFLMTIATIGAFAIGEPAEAVTVMLFYMVGEFFQDLAVRRSKKSISDLMDIRPDFANKQINGETIKVKPETVNIGDIIIVKPGEKIPLDGIVTSGESMLDTKALTGEAVPRRVITGSRVISGCISLNGVLMVRVTKTYRESTVAKIIDMVENASSKKAPAENFITTFSRYYTPAVVGFGLLLAVLPPLILGGDWSDWIHRALVFLVISCPCALVISIPLGFFGGIGCASRNGILVKGGNYLDALNKLEIVVFDKTGTLTKGNFNVTSVHPASDLNEEQAKERLLEYAAYAEAFSNHPIALSIMKAYEKKVNKGSLKNYNEIPGYGVYVELNSKIILAGNDKLMRKENIAYTESKNIGTKVYIAVDGKYEGCIVISDELKADSRAAIVGLKKMGVKKTVMLTGDGAETAGEVSRELQIDEVYYELLPNQKVEVLEMLEKKKSPKGLLAFVGDGINDAPVLARADVGLAMGGLGSDAAIEAADVVLMTDEPSKLIDAITIARLTKRIVWQNIIFALGVKGIFLILGAFGVSGMWEAVFADTGVAILAILNSLRVIYVRIPRYEAK